MKTHIAKLKAELKVLANQIKTIKPNLRRDQSSFDKKYPQRHNWDQYKILNKNEEFCQQQKEVWANYSNLDKAYEEYRAKHIAYCMLRGRTLEQIEPKLRDPHSWVHARVRKEAARIVASVLEEAHANPKP